ncbi:hypothetical protein ACQP1V_27305 [Microtetraspora malaysiensis]|uniref:hypothetical protein n=1 Tax=Microtetraspora malaysiensis TaxID=161358 RepID=UPI003D933C22
MAAEEFEHLAALDESLRELHVPVDQHLRHHGVRVGEWRVATPEELEEPPIVGAHDRYVSGT